MPHKLPLQIVGAFEKLPEEYTVIIPFAHTAGLDFRFNQLPLSRSFRLKKSSALGLSFPAEPELNPIVKALGAASEWSPDTLYLEATLRGYIGGIDTETLERFYQQVRALAGIGLAI
jgi:hypothetical protein